MGRIELLDCTLRDGGHINRSRFGKGIINGIIQSLLDSKVEIIEIGFLQNCKYDPDVAMYNNVEEAARNLPPKRNNVKYALMAQEDLYDIDKLEVCTGIVDVVRISFHDYDVKEGLACAKKVVEKGYQCFINPINLMGYSDEDIIALIKQVNEIGPYGFAIVDTFGSMMKEDLCRMYYLIDHNLDSRIELAIHLHENLSLSYSLAQTFLEINTPIRNVCIDASLYGMGRVPGNLCIELIMDYMNRTQGTAYDVEPVYDAIDHYIVDWKKQVPWGYSTAYALSAQHQVHRSFSEYLLKKGKLRTKQINQILSMIEKDRRTKYDKAYIEQLYAEFQNRFVDDATAVQSIGKMVKGKEVLVLAPGASLATHEQEIIALSERKDVVTISANFVWDKADADFVFFTNFRRLNEFGKLNCRAKKIITSNLMGEVETYDFVINYSDYAYYGKKVFDNAVIMLLNLLAKLDVKKIHLAGFDGFSEKSNFITLKMNFNSDYNYSYDNKVIKQIISSMAKELPLQFITPTLYFDGAN